MSITLEVPFQSARIPDGHTLDVTLADREQANGTVVTAIVYAEARNSEMGTIVGTWVDGEAQEGWPIWADRYLANLAPRIAG